MEASSSPIMEKETTGLKRLWRSRRRYARINGGNGKNLKVVRMGGGGVGSRRSWRIKVIPRLKLRIIASSPLKLWRKVKNAYMNMMLGLAGNMNSLCEANAVTTTGKRIPKARSIGPLAYSNTEFENRLIFEIYKNLVSSYELKSER